MTELDQFNQQEVTVYVKIICQAAVKSENILLFIVENTHKNKNIIKLKHVSFAGTAHFRRIFC